MWLKANTQMKQPVPGHKKAGRAFGISIDKGEFQTKDLSCIKQNGNRCLRVRINYIRVFSERTLQSNFIHDEMKNKRVIEIGKRKDSGHSNMCNYSPKVAWLKDGLIALETEGICLSELYLFCSGYTPSPYCLASMHQPCRKGMRRLISFHGHSVLCTSAEDC